MRLWDLVERVLAEAMKPAKAPESAPSCVMHGEVRLTFIDGKLVKVVPLPEPAA